MYVQNFWKSVNPELNLYENAEGESTFQIFPANA